MKNLCLLFVLVGLMACEKPASEQTQANTKTAAPETAKEPTFTIEETEVPAMFVMVMNDSAKSTEEIGEKLGKIYSSIGTCAENCKMESTGFPMAWYDGPNPPWKLTAGMAFTTKCPKPEPGIETKELPAGKAVVARYYGPYELSEKAYVAIEAYMKEKNLTSSGEPYEVYIGDPMVETDPYKVQTDIVFPVK